MILGSSWRARVCFGLRGSILINTSRYNIVNEKSLINALKRDMIYGAGIDLDIDDFKAAKHLKKLSNIIITPHTAGVTSGSIGRMDGDIADYFIEYAAKHL